MEAGHDSSAPACRRALSSKFKIAAFVVFTCSLVAWSQRSSMPGLSAQGRLALAIITSTVFAWAVDVVHAAYTTLLMFAALAATSVAPLNIVFGLFISPLAWMIVGSFLLAHAVVSSGLANRIAYTLLRRVAKGYKGLVVSIYATGLVLGIVIPHPIPRTLMLWAAYRSILEELTDDEVVLRLMCFAVFSSSVVTSMAFLTADSGLNLAAASLVGRPLSWLDWFWLMGPPSVIVCALHYVAFMWMFGPRIEAGLFNRAGGDIIRDALSRMGPVTVAEKKTLFWVLLAVVLWVTDRLHGVSPAWVALACVVGLAFPVVGEVLAVGDLSKSINWSTVIFVAGASAMGNVASSTGVTAWLSSLLSVISFPSGGPQFAVAAAILVMALHLVVGGALASVIVSSLTLLPIGTRLGFDPAVPCLIAYVVSNMQFVFPFQHINLLLGQNEPHGFSTAETSRFVPATTLLTLLSVALIYVPWWALIGALRAH